jgi:hypothetical protein
LGNLIAILATAPAPVILRRIDEHYFSLVGLAHVPQILEDPHFKWGMSSNFQKKSDSLSQHPRPGKFKGQL